MLLSNNSSLCVVLWLLLIILTVSLVCVSSLDKTMIHTTTGPIKGSFVHSYGVKYYSYQGIPYAEKPIGDLRFKPPVAKSPWTEVLDTTHPGHACPQTHASYKKEEMSEDCLYLNVFVPANQTAELLPVLFYIHGGEFMFRSGNANDLYGPQLLLRHNIIIVTFNYRLGALGFLSLNEEEASGNAGLKDIVLALQWVNDNADRFSGDRSKITIGGNSAGSVAAEFLLLSSKSVGLYNQAILISGSALGYRFLSRHPRENAIALGKELGITHNSPKELLERLKQVNAFDIIQAQADMGKNDTRRGFRPFAPFVPCVEIEYPDAFITEDPRTILKKGLPNNVPILVGFNAEEGLKMYTTIKENPKFLNYLNEDFQLCIPSDIGYPYGSKEAKELAKSIQNFYFDNANISDATIQNFIDLITDTMFTHSIEYAIQLYKEQEDSKKLYFYEFAFDGQLNFKVTTNLNRPGTAHVDELGYLFVTNGTKHILCNIDDRSRRMLDVMTGIMTNFVKFGNPTPENNNIGIVWEECGKDRNYLYIDDQLENVDSRPIPTRLQFWQDVYDRYYRYMENGGEIEYNIVP